MANKLARSRSRSSISISSELPEIQPDQLKVFLEIGQGRFKTVSSGCYSHHGAVAVLRYKADSNRNEIRILALLSKQGGSAHFPEVYGVLQERSALILAQEMSNFGSVKSVLQEPELTCMMSSEHKLRMSMQFAEALSFLEAVRIVHADIACRNFLVFRLEAEAERTRVKLTDFMSALCLPANTDHIVRKLPQATRWCAPETVAANVWSYKTEVWALGATLWELFTGGELPWSGYSKRADVTKKLRDLAVEFESDGVATDMSEEFPAPGSALCPSCAYAVVLSCLRIDVNARPSAKSLVAMFRQMQQFKVAESGSPKAKPVTEQELRLRNSIVIKPPRSSKQHQPAPSESSQGSELTKCNTPDSDLSRDSEQTKSNNSVAIPSVAAIARPSTIGHRARQVFLTSASRAASPRKSLEEHVASLTIALAPLSPMKTDAFNVATPATSCPSTPESPRGNEASASSSPENFGSSPSFKCSLDSDASFHALANSASFNADASFARANAASSPCRARVQGTCKTLEFAPLPRLMGASQSSETLQSIKALWSSPDMPQKADSLENVKDFLSSPEALCGIGPEKLILLRRKLAEAKVLEESNSQAMPRGVPLSDTLVPLIQKSLQSPRGSFSVPFIQMAVGAHSVSPRCAFYM